MVVVRVAVVVCCAVAYLMSGLLFRVSMSSKGILLSERELEFLFVIMYVWPALASALIMFVCVLMLFTKELTDASRAMRSAMAMMADAVPFFRNSILNASGCIRLSSGSLVVLMLGCWGSYVEPDLSPPVVVLVLV